MESNSTVLKKCARPGCRKPYSDEENDGAACRFHSGKPIFHDIKKGWDCCQRIVYDWDEFEKIEGCCTGPHTDQAQKTEFWKSSTVSNASAGLAKAVKMKTAEDFNREQEAKAKQLAAAKAVSAQPEEQKKAKTNKDGRYICANKGCTARTFLDEENADNACNHHTGEPIFHDLKKYWSCCNPDGKGKVAYDWDEFMLLETCAVGPHKKKYA